MNAQATSFADTAAARAAAGVLRWLDNVPYTLLAIPLRLALAVVFWNSAMAHLASWDTTLYLFASEYKVPVLPPDLAAYMAVSIEVSTPVLLVLGLLTRPAVLVLLGMTTVIEVFVYPQAWPTHIQWAAMMLVLLCRGPGKLSLDNF
ncbi:MAG: DoxX family protein, partial [Alphaproteobacteria bacterium]|nr:DoxX family protein [Alphaproteobacteria bacterium]